MVGAWGRGEGGGRGGSQGRACPQANPGASGHQPNGSQREQQRTVYISWSVVHKTSWVGYTEAQSFLRAEPFPLQSKVRNRSGTSKLQTEV